LVKWPSYSPNLNLNETIWAWMKKKLEDHNCTNLQQWKEAILKVRLERTEECEFLQNLVISMPTKMQEVIDWEGE
jgi:transposase